MKKRELTIEVPDNFDSMAQLETFIDRQGQRIKQRLFAQELQHLPNANITKPLKKIAILCGISWSFRQAADVIFN